MKINITETKEKYNSLEKQNLKISFLLRSPFVAVENINFDSILAYCVMRDILGEDFYNYQGCNYLIDIPLPCDERGDGNRKYWAASRGIFKGIESIDTWKKRYEEEYDFYIDFGKKQKTINNKSSFFKAYNMPVILQVTDEIVFFCNGNRNEIEKLLKYLCGFGKKISMGYGWIKEKKLESIKDDWSCFYDGIPMRPIPCERNNKEDNIEYTGYRPPYWFPNNQGFCKVR